MTQEVKAALMASVFQRSTLFDPSEDLQFSLLSIILLELSNSVYFLF